MITSKKFPWSYHPGLAYLSDPTIIRGKRIATCARVRIARELFPPMLPTKVFVVIEDENGNAQSVYRRAIRRAH